MSIPNLLTTLRMALAPLFVYLLLQGGQSLVHAAFVFTFAALTDYYDGYFARKQQRMTRFGAFFDPLADKMLVLGAFGAFMLLKLMAPWMVAVIVLRDLAVMGLRVVLLRHNLHVVTSRFAKWKTALQFVGIYLLMFSELLSQVQGTQAFAGFAEALLYTIVAVTALSGVHYFMRNWGQIRRLSSLSRLS